MNPRIPFRLANERPALPPIDGKPLIAHVVVNVEHWQFDRAMPRAIIPSPHGLESIPDVPNFSWVDYGMRCGLPRIIDALDRRGIPATVSFNAGVIEAYPAAAAAIRATGWEFMAHGVQQRSLQAVDDEEAEIVEALDRIERFTGTRPRGWLGPGLRETFETPDVLSAAGVDYVCDWVIDDLPNWVHATPRPLVSVPYSLELNDSVLHAVQEQPSDVIHRRLVDTLDVFDEELATQPRVLTLPLHPHLVGVPHRMAHLSRALDLLLDRDDTNFVTGSRIADWYADVEPYEAAGEEA